MVDKMKKKLAFSLVEILVALIIVSLITAALAPVITKKLSSAGITIVGGGSGNNTPTEAQWGEPRSQADCDPYNALYIPKVMNGGAKSICATKYNAGDANGPDIPSTVTAVTTAGTYCNSGNCCWKGTTANPSYCTTNDGGYGSNYNGCTRTVCNYPASVAICSSWAPKTKGLEVKTWRLATRSEAQGWVDNQDTLNHKQGANGLQLCSAGMTGGSIVSVDGFAQCAPANGSGYRYCHGAYGTDGSGGQHSCYAHDYWLDAAAELNFAGRYNFEVIQEQANSHYAFSTRCVTDSVPYPETIGSGNSTPVVNTCAGKYCTIGKYPDENNGCKCTTCSAPFCISCQNDVCDECLDGYDLVGGECIGGTESCRESHGKPTQACCESLDAMYLPKATTGFATDLCMMKHNAFDSTDFNFDAIQNEVKVVNVGQVCTNGSCCWKGTVANTASSCTSNKNSDSTYSGCNRTVCQATAAERICKGYSPSNYAPGAWRLMTAEELRVIGNNVATLSTNQGANGLQLCDNTSSTGTDKCATIGATNNGCQNISADDGSNNDCAPSMLWGQGNSTLSISNGSASVSSQTPLANPKSVRCVTSNVDSGTSVIHKPNEAIGEPQNQEDCDQFNALFIPAKYNGNLNGRNICITKKNMLDFDGTHFKDRQTFAKMSIKIADVAKVCTVGSCCWKGTTSPTCTSSFTYSGCKRSVCQATSAAILCATYAPHGSLRGSWRLPSPEELTKIGHYLNFESQHFSFLNSYLDFNGLQLCDDSSSSNGTDKCVTFGATTDGCQNSSADDGGNNDCAPSIIWGQGNYYMQLSGGGTSIGTHNSIQNPKSVRCVTESYLVSPNPNETDDGLPDDKLAQYQTECEKYNAIFIPKKFTGSVNLCMTKYNAFDPNGPYSNATNEEILASGVTKVDVPNVCSTGVCCWGGATSRSCTQLQNDTSPYSGCTRTVCQATAAAAICAAWAPQGTNAGDWRLLELNEMKMLATYLNFESNNSSFLNAYMGTKGLQLCDSNSSAYGIDKCGTYGATTDGCQERASDNEAYNDCMPTGIWGVNKNYLSIHSGVAYLNYEGYANNPKSVRCVTSVGVN